MTFLTRSMRFGDKTAADALVPRVELTAIEIEATVADLIVRALETGLSRFPVMGNDLDDIRGLVHIKSVHTVPPDERAHTPVTDLMVPAFAVPEGKELETLLVDMRRTRNHLAIVVDEHGGTAGIVTLEDIVEEIVGEIADEYDTEADAVIVEEPGSWLLAGSLHPDEVFEACGFRVPIGDFETLAGFALDRLQRIPEVREAFIWDGWEIEIVEMDRLRVANLRLTAPVEMLAPHPESEAGR